MRTKTTLILGAVAILGATLFTGSASATSSGVTTTILAKSTFDSTVLSGFARLDGGKGFPSPSNLWLVYLQTHGLTDGYVVDNVFSAGGTTGWHSHPGPSIIYVVKGSVTNYDSDVPQCAGHVYAAGTSFTDPGGRDIHMLKNEGTDPAETIAVQFVPAGAARKTDQPTPAGCPAS
jgi:Cupin domain